MKSFARQKAEQNLRAMYAELCYWYPQYKLEDLTNDDCPLALGDINLLLTYARMQYYQDKADTLTIIAAGNGGKKPYKSVSTKLLSLVKKLKARI